MTFATRIRCCTPIALLFLLALATSASVEGSWVCFSVAKRMRT